jgi:hypothetical protein
LTAEQAATPATGSAGPPAEIDNSPQAASIFGFGMKSGDLRFLLIMLGAVVALYAIILTFGGHL